MDKEKGKVFDALQMNVNSLDFHNAARLFRESGVVGEPQTEPYADMQTEMILRGMGLRLYIYHEMTHVLQRAYMNIQAREAGEDTNFIIPQDTDLTTMYADDTKYMWKWGRKDPKDATIPNFDVASESQAEGVAFDALMYRYHMSTEQREVVWEHLHGRLDESRATLLQIQDIFENDYPRFSPGLYWRLLSNTVPEDLNENDADFFSKMIKRIMLAPYIGYHHPMKRDDLSKFWRLFR
jgi:hypothetical protein